MNHEEWIIFLDQKGLVLLNIHLIPNVEEKYYDMIKKKNSENDLKSFSPKTKKGIV